MRASVHQHDSQVRVVPGCPAHLIPGDASAERRPVEAVIGRRDGLRALGAKKLSLASPYAPWLNERLKQYLTADGFEVLAMQGLSTEAHSTITRERILALVEEVVRPDTEAIFISCSNFRTLEIIDGLEQKYQLPVVTSNASMMWAMLRLMNDKRDVPGAGRLFKLT